MDGSWFTRPNQDGSWSRPCWQSPLPSSVRSPFAICAGTTRSRYLAAAFQEWKLLSGEIVAAFAESSSVTPEHPCAEVLQRQAPYAARLAAELRDREQWVDGCYTRTTLMSCDGFVVLLLCWSPGVSSPVHAHSDAETNIKSNCFMLVLEGALTETRYAPEKIIGPDTVRAAADPAMENTTRLAAGDYAYINDSQGVHKVANASETERAVSLHVYAPGWTTVPLYNEVIETDAGGAAIDIDEWGDF